MSADSPDAHARPESRHCGKMFGKFLIKVQPVPTAKREFNNSIFFVYLGKAEGM